MLRISWSHRRISSQRRFFLSRLFWLFRLADCHHRMALLRQRKVEEQEQA